jgi:D-alanyl-D-alanine-carboxypeptidase/D-alanyl-D-alanine-endopeptidase
MIRDPNMGFTTMAKIRRIAALALAVGLVVAATTPSRAADPVLAQATDLAGLVMFLESGAPGMVLAVVRGDDEIVRGFGETAPGSKQEPNGKSLLRLNSINKVFTTEALVSLVADGKLRLTDPLQRWAGEAKVPDFKGRPITLLDLATHSAALPREIGDAPADAAPRTWPARADRWTWLSGYHLPWAPGTMAAYSNISFDLLSDAIETADGRPFPEVLRARVTGPLGMVDTGFAPTPEQCQRLMTGTGLGSPGRCVDTHATNGSGGLYSTGDDMAIWLRHNLEANETLALSHAVYWQRQNLAAAIGFDEPTPMAGLGLGWVMVAANGAQPALLTKSGGGVGFMSYVAFAPGRGVGVFVAINRTDFGIFAALVGAANGLIATLVTR